MIKKIKTLSCKHCIGKSKEGSSGKAIMLKMEIKINT